MAKEKPTFKRNELFEFLGCHLNNPRWSWCALSADQNRAIFSVWEDRYQGGKWRLTPEENSNELGAHEQRRISQKAYEQEITSFGILCVVKDANARPRSIKQIKSDELISLRLVEEEGVIYGVRTGQISSLEFAIRERSYNRKKNAIDDLSEIPQGKKVPDRAKKITEFVKRDNKVRAYVIRRAQGHCEYCGIRGFALPDGSYYVETHHIIALGDSGCDMVNNVIALCPTHHRQAHYGADAENLEGKFSRKLEALNVIA
jgi:5-methylcytosine-specific restriction protein A